MHNVKIVKSASIFPTIKTMIDEGQNVQITVTGISMRPFLEHQRDFVELTKTSFSEIKKGDVVLIKRDTGAYVLHRVIKKTKDTFYQTGDNQYQIEGPLYGTHLLAKVAYAIRKDRKISVENKSWIILSNLWMFFYPIRKIVFKFREGNIIKRGVKKVIKLFNK